MNIVIYIFIFPNISERINTYKETSNNDTYNPVLVNRVSNVASNLLTLNTYHLFRNNCLDKVETIRQRSLLAYLAVIPIKTSNDINLNPEPETTVYPCGTCDHPVTWNDRGIVCDTCNQWYHVSCH